LIVIIVTSIFITSGLASSLKYVNLSSSEKWSKIYGGTGKDQAYSIIQTHDLGYAIVGYTESYGVGQDDVWIIKTDEYGNELWNKTYGGIKRERGYDITQTGDNGLIIIGYTETYGEGLYDVWLIKTDEFGNEIWNKTYGGYDYDLGSAIIETDDGGYVLAGYTSSQGPLNCNVWIIKTDQQGNMIWNKTIGGNICESSFSLVATEDRYVIVGYTESFGAGDYDGWVIVVDHQGNMIWNKTYGGKSTDVFRSIRKTNDNGFIIAGFTTSIGKGNEDIWIIKIDDYGTIQWEKTYGGPLNDRAYSLSNSNNEEIIITGCITNLYTQSNLILIKIDKSGDIIWKKSFGGFLNDKGHSVIMSEDGGFVITGWTNSNQFSNENVWILKTDEYGNIDKNKQIKNNNILSLKTLLLRWFLFS
jgi:regulation of enolase protein 1 (concanavalin A-like superfamily)